MDPRLNKRYAELCQELGHLQCSLELLEKRISEIKVEIFGLNLCAPLIAANAKHELKEEPKRE